jgi:uncharacterized protein (DUF1330 family)
VTGHRRGEYDEGERSEGDDRVSVAIAEASTAITPGPIARPIIRTDLRRPDGRLRCREPCHGLWSAPSPLNDLRSRPSLGCMIAADGSDSRTSGTENARRLHSHDDFGSTRHRGTIETRTAYVISDVAARDPELVARYRELARASIKRYGGRYLTNVGAEIDHVEGDWTPLNLVMVAFPSLARARQWYASEEYPGAGRSGTGAGPQPDHRRGRRRAVTDEPHRCRAIEPPAASRSSAYTDTPHRSAPAGADLPAAPYAPGHADQGAEPRGCHARPRADHRPDDPLVRTWRSG